jgi:hemerythrin
MPFMVWCDKLSVGVEALDADHKNMIAIINELYEGILAGRNKEIVGDIIERLVDYTRSHFAREEGLLAECGYPETAAHKKEHDEMAVWAERVEVEFFQGTLAAPSLEVMNRLKDWLFDHIGNSDQRYTRYMKDAGIE